MIHQNLRFKVEAKGPHYFELELKFSFLNAKCKFNTWGVKVAMKQDITTFGV